MKRILFLPNAACLLLLLVVLCGCTLRERRSTENPVLEPNQLQQQSTRTTTATGGNETTPATQSPDLIIPLPESTENAIAENIQEGDLGLTLLDELNALDTANQDGDSLDDLP